MKKETFCEILRNLHDTEENAQRIETAINEAYQSVNGNSFMDRINVVDAIYPYNLHDSIVNALEREMNDTDGLISAFVYEWGWGEASPCDEGLPRIYTLEQLYDALVKKE